MSLHQGNGHCGNAAQPVFIVGTLRSGANLLALSLGQHPRLALTLEMPWLGSLAEGLFRAYRDGVRRHGVSQIEISGIERDEFMLHFGTAAHALIARSIALSCQVHGSGDEGSGEDLRWIDVTPEHALMLPGLLLLFPRARVIHVLRDVGGCVAALTCQEKRASYRSQHILMSVGEAYHHWMETVSFCVEAERAYGSATILRIRRSDLLTDPESTLRRCLEFIDEFFDPAVLRPFRELFLPPDEKLPFTADGQHAVHRHAHLLSDLLMQEGIPNYPRDDRRVLLLEQAFFDNALRCSQPKRGGLPSTNRAKRRTSHAASRTPRLSLGNVAKVLRSIMARSTRTEEKR
jgi:hypothetical protein